MEDYYKLLGVQSDDERETIRDAYRARKAELDEQGTEGARAEASRLNRAWNVLSDDLQRGRYDDQLAEAKAEGTVEESPEFEPEPDTSARGRGARSRNDRPVRQPIAQETEVNGIPLASNKDRFIATAIDGFIVLLLLLVAPIPLVQNVAKSQKPEVTDRIDELADERKPLADRVEEIDGEIDDAKDAKQAAQDDGDDDAAATAQQKIDALEDEREGVVDEVEAIDDLLADEQGKLMPLYVGVLGVLTALTLLVLVVPSALTGRSLGKAVRKIRLRRETGELPGWLPAIKRYAPFVIAIGFGQLLGTIGLILMMVAMFGVTSYNRNPRRQGWHDRLAHTIVAAD